ncbi:MAG: NUDIX hydrolase [Candidatus Levybacteria bacterium]|nr:NUDIX hydrolase [Candidatus Levybacteria bacterium]
MNNTKSLLHEAIPRNLDQLDKPAVSVQVLIFSINKGKLEIVLIKRMREPFKDYFSIPGDIITVEESLNDAAKRILYEKTGIKNVYLGQLETFGEVNRDPRGRVIAVAYYSLLPHNSVDLSKAPNGLHASWIPVEKLSKLAFDHEEIIKTAIKRIKSKLLYSNIAGTLLPESFRLSELQKAYEIILEEKIDKRNFRKKMLSLDVIESTGEIYKLGNHRPAMLYKFKSKELIHYD